MKSRISVFLLILGVAAMGTFGFGLMGYAAQHLCPVVVFFGYQCPSQNATAGFNIHHLATLRVLAKAVAEAGLNVALIMFLLAAAVSLRPMSFLQLFANIYSPYTRQIIGAMQESVFWSRRQYFNWLSWRIEHEPLVRRGA